MIKEATFGQALEHLKSGGTATRQAWHYFGVMHISLAVNVRYKNLDGADFIAENEPCGTQCIILHNSRGRFPAWTPTQSDMLCDDWILL